MSQRLSDTVFYALEKSIKSYRQFAQANIDRAGVDITIDQWLVLITLRDNPDVPLQQVGTIVFKDLASVSRIVQLVVDKGYVRRLAHPDDGRRLALSLTSVGIRVVEAIEPIIKSNRRSALQGIDAESIACTHAVLATIIANCQAGDLA